MTRNIHRHDLATNSWDIWSALEVAIPGFIEDENTARRSGAGDACMLSEFGG
jgi:hypothetical protein